MTDVQFTAMVGLAGVAVGWGLNTLTEWVRRRWSRADKLRDTAIERGEELIQRCSELIQWGEDASRAAFHGSDVSVPIPHAIYRIAAIVDLYVPELRPDAVRMDKATSAYRVALVDVCTSRHRGLPMNADMNQKLQSSSQAFYETARSMMDAARRKVRPLVEC